MLEIKNAIVVVVVFIFLKYNGLCERLADSNLYTHTQITQRKKYCAEIFIQVTLFACMLHT